MPHPSLVKFSNRKDNRTPLLKAVTRAKMAKDPPPNFCPFGCEAHQLDDNGYCHHLIGFTDGGRFFEPRKPTDHMGITTLGGKHKLPMRKGFVRVPISVSARVYARQGNDKLVVVKGDDAEIDAKVAAAEREFEEKLVALRTPRLDGVFGSSDYELPAEVDPSEFGFDAGEDDKAE